MARKKTAAKTVKPYAPHENVLVPLAMPPNAYDRKRQLYPMARIRDPHNPEKFYREGNPSWVTTGYKTWTIADWIERFKGQQPDGRHWDFFGENIDIWEGYSEE